MLKTEGIQEEDLIKFVAEEKRQLELRVRNNGYWLYQLKSVYKGERQEDYFETYPGVLEELTTEQLKQAANEFLDDRNFIRVVLMPERIE